MQPSELLDDNFVSRIVNIVLNARIAVMECYNNASTGVEYKNDNTPLTLADKMASDIICEGLMKISDIPIICEETKSVPYETRKNYSYVWIVDPVDGTKEFIKRNGEFTINVGLVLNGLPVFGVVDIPCQKKTYVGIVHQKRSYIIGDDGTHNDIRTVEYGSTDEGLKIFVSRTHSNKETIDFVDKYKLPEIVNSGSSIKFLRIAEGSAHIYPRIAPTMEWDTCAAHAVVDAAGAFLVDYKTKQKLTYNKEDLHNPFFVCHGVEHEK